MSNTPIIHRIRDAKERRHLSLSVLDDLDVLGEMLADNAFETGKRRVGAEQELDFIDRDFRPAPLVPEILNKLGDGPFTTEYAKFNLEINSQPHEITGDVFKRLQSELQGSLDHVADVAREHFDARVILTGLLPTIRRHDVRPEALTPSPRYKTMLALVNRLRGGEYEFKINGIDELVTRDNPTVFGGTFTSFQVHCQTDPALLPAHYNWAQMIAGPSLAAATNSPLFLGRRLWRETRIALFAQTTDTRRPQANLRGEEPRVSFGRDWARRGILDVFREDYSRYRAYVTSDSFADSRAAYAAGKAPDLEALNFHNGTIYRWNRICYGNGGDVPHLRIENRIIPAGPTLVDEMANTAFWLGLMLAMPEDTTTLPDRVPFQDAHSNFFKAARNGLGTAFRWYGKTIEARELIIEELLPMARRGLESHGVDTDSSGDLLGIIANRVESGRTGAQWILDAFDILRETKSPGEAAVTLTAEMFDRASTGEPVDKWAPVKEGGKHFDLHCDNTWSLEQVMNPDLITIHPDDPQEFVAKLMSWNEREFLPVVDDDGKFKGVLSRNNLFERMTDGTSMPAGELIRDDVRSLPLHSSIEEGLAAMRDSGVDCVAVVEGGAIAGLVTGHDIVRIAPSMLGNRQEARSDEDSTK